jgi:hypothetical protein
VTVRLAGFAMLLASSLTAVPIAGPIAPPLDDPAEVFDVVATVTPAGSASSGRASGGITVPMVITIERYSPERARNTMTDALKFRGYPGFLEALRAAPRAGSVDVAGQSFVIRWARQVDASAGRNVSIVTDTPVYFVGGGRRGAKPTAGYEVAVAQLTLDKTGHGTGTMAAAARVKPGGETGVRIDDYAEKPVTLAATVRGAK